MPTLSNYLHGGSLDVGGPIQAVLSCRTPATGAFRTSPIPSLYATTGEPPLSVRRQVLCLQLYCRLQSMPNTPTYATVMNRAHDVLFSTLPYHVPLGPRGLLERLPVDELNIMKGVRYLDSPWRAPIPEFCPGISGVSKSDNHPEALKAMFPNTFTSNTQRTKSSTRMGPRLKLEPAMHVYLELGLFSVNSLTVLLSIQQNYWQSSMFLLFWYKSRDICSP